MQNQLNNFIFYKILKSTYAILNKEDWLTGHIRVSLTFLPRNPAKRSLLAVSAAIEEQRILSALLTYSLLREITR